MMQRADSMEKTLMLGKIVGRRRGRQRMRWLDVYTTVGALNVGDVVNVEGFLYWYEGVNPHITSITVA